MATRKRGWRLPAGLGGACLAIGVFAPLAVVDYWGEVTLHEVSPEQALLVLAAGAAALLAAALDLRRWVRPIALLTWVAVLLPFLRNRLAPEPGVFESMTNWVTEPVSEAFGNVALQMTEPSWGVTPLFGGLLLVTVAARRSGGR